MDPIVQKNFGFGFMRLPMKDGEVDIPETTRMVDAFLEAGFNYFDTAHGYLGGKSELALRECLTSRYPREKYVLTNKLTSNFFRSTEDIRPFFQTQLECCGVSYFDYYLMHSQNEALYEKYKRCRAYETALELKEEGLIRHFGISFHDKPALLDQILTEYPQVEVVQIQLNYADFDDPAVESRKCLEVCRKHQKPAIVMEPVKGGSLVNLPQEARDVFDALGGGSYASYAIRFAAGQEGVKMVLSGMSNLQMVLDNIGFMQDFKPLTEKELAAVEAVRDIFRKCNTIPCTACGYCTQVCPKNIPIPAILACYNAKKLFRNWNTSYYYEDVIAVSGKSPADCVGCGACRDICPQHLNIPELLKTISREFQEKR